MSTVTMNTQQEDVLSINPTGASGEPEALDAPATWSTSDATIATVTPSADGSSCVVVSVSPGNVTVTVSAASDGNTLTASQDYVIQHPAANSLNLSAGAPQAIPPATPPAAPAS